MDIELQKKIDEQGVKIDAIYASVEKTRRYFLIVTWVTVFAVILPLIGLAIEIPNLINQYSALSNIN
jgi:hypothetical protein